MKITKISLTNFRSFKATQEIDLAPVTLLFGPNSVGKSSVLMALAYIQQILKKGHCNPQKLGALGDKKIGGFRSLVYGQDTSSAIKIRLGFDGKKTPFVSYDAGVDEMANHVVNAAYPLMNDFGGNIETGSIEFEVAWSNRHQWAYVKNLRVWINDDYVGSVSSSDDLKNSRIVELNTLHPLLVPYNNDDWLESTYGPPEEWEDQTLSEDELHTHFEEVLNGLNPNPISTIEPADTEGAGQEFTNRIAPIAIGCSSGSVPYLGIPVSTMLDGQDFDQAEEHMSFLVVQQVLSQGFVLPLDKLLEQLEKNVLIGPLRVVPDIDYVANPNPEQQDWVDGSAAWDLLHRDPSNSSQTKKLLSETSDWFANKNKLNTGYELVNHSLSEELGQKLLDVQAMPGIVDKRHLLFRELKFRINLTANQLGTGISQVLPLVVAANTDSVGMISVEQPELHIHPRLQTELADLFLETRGKHSYLIETHSEHLILRLLRRIRETADGDLPEGMTEVVPETVSIVYLEPSEEGVRAKRIRIDEDGEFKERWPQGFFTERREELM